MKKDIGKPNYLRSAGVLLAATAVLATANAAQANLYAVTDLGIFTDPDATVSGINNIG